MMSEPIFTDVLSVYYIDHMGAEKRIVDAARVSTASIQDGEGLSPRDSKLLGFLMREGHTSPFEHCTLTVKIECPLFTRSQIMRHRTFSYNEISRRYTEQNIKFYVPNDLYQQHSSRLQCSSDEIIDAPDLLHMMSEQIKSSLRLYTQLLDEGVSREQARIILPQCLMTSFYMTGNLHNWLKFIALRDTDHAQDETRAIARQILDILREFWPETLRLWSVQNGHG
jgi:thymidylate synthase (FAD)